MNAAGPSVAGVEGVGDSGVVELVGVAHWLSDVLAGMSLGLFWFMLVVLVERSITGMIKAVRHETKEAEPIKAAEVVKTVKKIIPKKKKLLLFFKLKPKSA